MSKVDREVLPSSLSESALDLWVAVRRQDTDPWRSYALRDLTLELQAQGFKPRPVGQRLDSSGVLVKHALEHTMMTARNTDPKCITVVPAIATPEPLYLASSTTVVPYCLDVWEPGLSVWVGALRAIQPPMVFASARDSAELLRREIPNLRVLHCPEGTRVASHLNEVPLTERRIGVLEFGRRYDEWHSCVADDLAKHGVAHMFPRDCEAAIFHTEDDFRSGLSQAIISICFPRSMTHPDETGAVETMTIRYLESMASGCIVVGHAPEELVDLMGYNPVVEIDWNAPSRQILNILKNPAVYQPWVIRARERVSKVGDWSARVRVMASTMHQTLAN